ncbi:MAG: amidohydrolase [Ignavibacteria bacterium]|nr:amidohydrolase [Bacteroidota bacterium]MSQ45689.1 amidohydrolase [Ignavibacteria bacterium]
MKIKLNFIKLFFLLFYSVNFLISQQKADLVILNGKVWTVDETKPEAEAIAILGERIIEVGSEKEIRQYISTSTKIIDAQKKLILPGLIDNHAHFTSGGFEITNIDLRNAKSEIEFASRIIKRAKEKPGMWIKGGGWDHENWKSASLPTKELIDSETQTTPVFVDRLDGHMALANSFVIKLAGITKDTPNPPGGTIVKDSKTGEPTGVLKDEAMSLVYKIIPPQSFEEAIQATSAALTRAKELGLTSIQDMTSSMDLKAYQELKKRNQLTARLYCRMPISQWKDLENLGIETNFGDNFIKLGSLKGYADGSLGSSTALFFKKYESENTFGLPSDILLDGRLENWGTKADKSKLQLSIHAIGDSANNEILNIFQRIQNTNPIWDRRFRIEHAQHLNHKDVLRFKKLNVIASMQPSHAIDDGRWAVKRIGSEREKEAYVFRSILDEKITLTFGSDWPVAPLNPMLGIYAAVTRRTLDGKNPNGWIPEQKITVKEAIKCYTINNAYSSFEENEKGSITKGKLADIIILSEDILTIDPVKIENVKVEMTIVGGRIVFQK